VLELCYRRFNAIQKIGAHIAQDKSRIDFDWAENLVGALPSIQEQAMDLIRADRPIVSAFSDADNERRYWEIEGFARVACGGTHLKRTGEIGVLRLKRRNVGKGKERIEIFVDDGGSP
jgi:Ser-tRNA(Ala) deacylase AlaX